MKKKAGSAGNRGNYIITRYLLRNRFPLSRLLFFGPQNVIYVEMNVLKTLQRLEAATERCSEK